MHYFLHIQYSKLTQAVVCGLVFCLSLSRALAQTPTLPTVPATCDYATAPATITLSVSAEPVGFSKNYLLVDMVSGKIVATNPTSPTFTAIPQGIYYAVGAYYTTGSAIHNDAVGKLISDVYVDGFNEACLKYSTAVAVKVCTTSCDYTNAPATISFTSNPSSTVGVSTKYVLVDEATNKIVQVSNTASFTAVLGGSYSVVAVYYINSLALAVGDVLYDKTTNDANCVGVSNTIHYRVCVCVAGTVAPALSTTSLPVICPANTANLSAITASNLPVGAVLEWHTAAVPTSANKVANASAVPQGMYYAVFFDSNLNCYSPATTFTVTDCDRDFDGIVDSVDSDDDGDGILDAVEDTCNLLFENFGANTSIALPTSTILVTGAEAGIYNTVPVNGVAYIAGGLDHTPNDVNGNMLLVSNVATAKVVYSKTITGLTVGSTYNFSAWLTNPVTSGFLPPNVTLRAYDQSNNLIGSVNTGNIPSGSYTWTKYGFNITAPTTSVRVEVYTNASGVVANNFSGEDFVLDDITFAPTVCDADGDGIANSLDLDADNDGIPDNIEAQATASYVAPSGFDTDGDGLDNAYEGAGNAGLTPVNTEGADNPDFIDTDSDNAQGNDTNESGIVLDGVDSDHDGLDDAVDTNDAVWGPVNSNGTSNINSGGLLTAYPNNGTQVYWRLNTTPPLPNITASAGSVYNDNGAGGGIANDCVKNGTEATTTLPANTFYINLVQGSTVVQSSPVAANGSYLLTGISDGSYQLIITNSATATTVVMPTGWALVSGTGIASIQVTTGVITPSTAPAFCLKQVVDITGTPGSIFNDNGSGTGIAGNCIKDGTEGTATLPTGLFINLVQGGLVVKSSPVAANGSYSFTGVNNGTYSAVLTTSNTSVTAALPAGWAFASGTGTSVVSVSNGALVGSAPSFCIRQILNITVPAGTVYVDNGIGGGTAFNCVKDGTEGATPIPANTFWINLVQGSVVVKSSVIATDGSYTLSGVFDGTYTVVITTNPTSTTTAMPTNWELSSGTGSATITVTNGVVSPATPTAFCLKNCVFTLPTLNK